MSRQFSKEIERTAFFRAKGRCEGCSARLASGDIHYDHIVPWALSFDSSIANCQVLCNPCHRDKTANRDVPPAACRASRRRSATASCRAYPRSNSTGRSCASFIRGGGGGGYDLADQNAR